MWRRTCFVSVVLSVLLSGLTPCAGDIYWSEMNLIRRASDDGSSVQAIVTGVAGTRMQGIAFDLPNGHLYYGADGPGRGVYRANLDGTGPVLLVPDYVADVELDLVNRKVYWSSRTPTNPGLGGIRRANLDGSSVEALANFGNYDLYMGVALDPAAGKLYYTGHDYSVGTPYVAQANLDASNPITLAWARHSEHTHELEIDGTTGKLYVVQTGGGNYPTGLVSELNLDGTEYGTLLALTASGAFSGIALDTAEGHLYYGDFRDNNYQIRRVNTDGTGDELVLDGLDEARYIEYAVPELGTIAMLLAGAALGVCLAHRRRRRPADCG